VYEFGDNKAVGILKSGKNPVKIDQELQILNQIDKLGLPTVNAQRIVVDGKPAILMD
jgi:filamentous hemagglutinin